MSDKILLRTLIALGVMNLADYLFTMRAVYVLGIAEGNPAIDATLGTPWFFVLKALLVPLGLAIVWRTRKAWNRRVVIGGLLVFVTAAYGGVTAWHVWGQMF